jgi:hypothetical protein
LRIADCGLLIADLKMRPVANRRGVKAEDVSSRYGAEGEGPSIYLNDPEGNVIELKGAPW